MSDRKPDMPDRMGSMIIDNGIMMIIAGIALVPNIIYVLVALFCRRNVQDADPVSFFGGPVWYFSLIGFAFYIAKDSFNGRSIAKRIMGLQVVNNITGLPADPIRCAVRNLTCIIWPVEAIMAIVTPERRLGDMIAGTRIAVYDDKAEQAPAHYGQAFAALLLSYLFAFLVTIPLIFLQKWGNHQGTQYVKSSYNKAESEELGRLLTDSLDHSFTSSIRIYDKVENDSIKFISCKFEMHDEYLADAFAFDSIMERTENLIYARYPQTAFKGYAEYNYRYGASKTHGLGRGEYIMHAKKKRHPKPGKDDDD
ncbi:MAG: Na/Pi-cotransporter II-related protein [Bacteroidetes bacterium]|nr:Na/Pi-cotransporter II-related protein [Bacteroidota bacterium]